MISDEIKKKLQDIINGTLLEGQQDHCTTIRNLLCQSFETGPTIKSEFESKSIIKEEQRHFLKAYAEKANLWIPSLPAGCQYLTRGGESTVYLAPDNRPGQSISIALLFIIYYFPIPHTRCWPLSKLTFAYMPCYSSSL